MRRKTFLGLFSLVFSLIFFFPFASANPPPNTCGSLDANYSLTASVTTSGTCFTIAADNVTLDCPFLVLATQNTIESIGVYILPAAQLDRFLFKLVLGYPEPSEEKFILKKNVSYYDIDDFGLKQIVNTPRLLKMQGLVHKIYLSRQIEDYIVNLVDATRRPAKYGLSSGKYIQLGASPRASLGLYIGAKAQALMEGSTFVTPEHVKEVATDVMRHRIMLNYEGQAEEITPDMVISEVLEKVEVT